MNISKFLNYQFNQRQLDIIEGGLLGDGCLSKVINSRNSRYSERHKISHEEYLKWKMENIGAICGEVKHGESQGRNCVNGKVVDDESKKYQYCEFKTRVCITFTELERKWYLRDETGQYVLNKGKRIKIIPKGLRITPLMLYVLYMDDGTNVSTQRRCEIYTLSFRENEVDYLVEQIKSIFGFDCYKSKEGESHKIIISSRSYIEFIKFIQKQNSISCMDYKCNLDKYVELKQKSPIRKLTAEQISNIEDMRYNKNMTLTQISSEMNCSFQCVSSVLKKQKSYSPKRSRA